MGFESTTRLCHISSDNIVVVGAIMLFVLFTFVIYRSRTILAYKIKTYFSSRQIYAANDFTSNDREQIDIILLILIGLLEMSLALFADARHSNPIDTLANYTVLFHIFLTILLITAFQAGAYILINWVFFSPDAGRRWLSSYIYLYAATSIIILPLATARIFAASDSSTNITYCLLGVFILQKIILFFKLFANFKPKKYGRVLFFLYFCSVEIMPSLITIHILRQIDVIG